MRFPTPSALWMNSSRTSTSITLRKRTRETLSSPHASRFSIARCRVLRDWLRIRIGWMLIRIGSQFWIVDFIVLERWFCCTQPSACRQGVGDRVCGRMSAFAHFYLHIQNQEIIGLLLGASLKMSRPSLSQNLRQIRWMNLVTQTKWSVWKDLFVERHSC